MRMLVVVITALFAPAAGAAYKCVDAKGVTHFGDTPPPGCAEVVMYEINKSGAIVRRIDPTPTPEQIKERDAQFEREREALKIKSEKQRKDMALLNTFSSEREFDVARDRNIEPIKGRIASAQDRIKQVDKRTKEIEEEMEFYKAGKSKAGKERATPANLSADLNRAKTERATLVANIASYEKEIEQTKVKFDTDKKRWLEIKYAGKASAAKAAEPADAKKTPTTAKPGDSAPADPKAIKN